MADTPPFGVRFKSPPRNEERSIAEPEPEPGSKAGVVQRHDRAVVYQQALDFAAQAFLVLEHSEAERFYLRDQLDRKSAIIPQFVAQGLGACSP